MTFTDAKSPALWTIANHPGLGAGDPRVIRTALRAAMLDYRALLDTNYGQGRNEPNLFNIAMELLLADWPVAGTDTLGKLWSRTKAAKPSIGWDDGAVKTACANFNTEFAAAVDALTPFAREVLKDLLDDTVTLRQLEYGTIRYVNDPCVTEEFLKLYVAYKAETNFVDIVPQAKQLVLSLNIPFSVIDDPRGLCRDVSGLGRWGNGDVEVRLSEATDLPYVVVWSDKRWNSNSVMGATGEA